MEPIDWSLRHYLVHGHDYEGVEITHKHYALDVQGYDVADYDHFPSEEEVLRDVHVFWKGQERGDRDRRAAAGQRP